MGNNKHQAIPKPIYSILSSSKERKVGKNAYLDIISYSGLQCLAYGGIPLPSFEVTEEFFNNLISP
jgi:hypothetical protein